MRFTVIREVCAEVLVNTCRNSVLNVLNLNSLNATSNTSVTVQCNMLSYNRSSCLLPAYYQFSLSLPLDPYLCLSTPCFGLFLSSLLFRRLSSHPLPSQSHSHFINKSTHNITAFPLQAVSQCMPPPPGMHWTAAFCSTPPAPAPSHSHSRCSLPGDEPAVHAAACGGKCSGIHFSDLHTCGSFSPSVLTLLLDCVTQFCVTVILVAYSCHHFIT